MTDAKGLKALRGRKTEIRARIGKSSLSAVLQGNLLAKVEDAKTPKELDKLVKTHAESIPDSEVSYPRFPVLISPGERAAIEEFEPPESHGLNYTIIKMLFIRYIVEISDFKPDVAKKHAATCAIFLGFSGAVKGDKNVIFKVGGKTLDLSCFCQKGARVFPQNHVIANYGGDAIQKHFLNKKRILTVYGRILERAFNYKNILTPYSLAAISRTPEIGTTSARYLMFDNGYLLADRLGFLAIVQDEFNKMETYKSSGGEPHDDTSYMVKSWNGIVGNLLTPEDHLLIKKRRLEVFPVKKKADLRDMLMKAVLKDFSHGATE